MMPHDDAAMSLRGRVAFGLVAVGVLAVVSSFCLREAEQAVLVPPPAALAAAPGPVAAAAPDAVAVAPAQREPSSAVPWNDLTRTAATRNEVIYTTSKMGEPMEVHPDGTVVIHNHRKVFTYADGRQEVRYARITAKPSFIPLSGIQIPKEDQEAPK
jgi:hypothetical protein